MNEKQIKRWEAIRQKGKWHFVLLDGIVKWGFSTAILSSLLTYLITPLFNNHTVSFSPTNLLLSFVIFSIMGILFGLSLWWLAESRYQQYQATPPNNGDGVKKS